jgi:prepilin-type N-terminal cleavage/methylation domain-containing protein
MQVLPLIKPELTSNRGFTLVEVIIVMLIMSVVMTAVVSLIVPAQRSSVIQSDLSTVQGGMRVTLERLSKDFRNAGFLFAGAPISSAGYPVNTTVSETVVIDASVNSITINTRAVSGVFGRVDTIPASTAGSFTLIYPEQASNFPVGSYAAVVEPVNGVSIGDVYYVMNSITTSGTGFVKLGDKSSHNELTSAESDAFASSPAGLVLLRVPSSSIATILAAADPVDATLTALNRTITYAHADTDGDGTADTLTRQVDGGNVSFLARGISELTFTVEEDGDGDVSKVSIDLVGESIALGSDTVSSTKTQRSRITVSLRNV